MIIAEVPKPRHNGNNGNHPDYYNRNGIEVWDVIEAFGLSVPKGFAVKYILRAGHKEANAEKQDIQKAINCLQRELEEIERKEKAERFNGGEAHE